MPVSLSRPTAAVTKFAKPDINCVSVLFQLFISLLVVTSLPAGAVTRSECLAQANPSVAIETCTALINNGEGTADVYLHLTNMLIEKQDFPASLNIVRQGLTSHPNSQSLRRQETRIRNFIEEENRVKDSESPDPDAKNRASTLVNKLKCKTGAINKTTLQACQDYISAGGNDSALLARMEALKNQLTPKVEIIEPRPAVEITNNPPAPIVPTPPTNGVTKEQLEKRELVSNVQQLLNELEYPTGVPDGYSGPRTERAIATFYNETGSTPRYPISQELQKQLQQALANKKSFGSLIAKAQQQLRSGNTEQALQTASQANSIAPWLRVPANLVQEIQTSLQNETSNQQYLGLMAKARQELSRKRFDAALNTIDEALQIQNGNSDAITLRQQVFQQRAQHNKEQQNQSEIAEFMHQAEQALQSGKFNEALSLASQADAIDPSVANTSGLRRRIKDTRETAEADRQKQLRERQQYEQLRQQQLRISELLKRAEQALQAGNFTEALSLAGQADAINPSVADTRSLRRRIDADREKAEIYRQNQLREKQQFEQQQRQDRELKIADLLQSAEQALQAGELNQALSLAGQADAIDPSVANTRSLRRRIEADREKAEIDRQKQLREKQQFEQQQQQDRELRITELLKSAEDAIQLHQYSEALDRVVEADSIDSRFADTSATRLRIAQNKKQYEEKTQQIENLIASANIALGKKDLDTATEYLKKAERVDPVIADTGRIHFQIEEQRALLKRNTKSSNAETSANLLTKAQDLKRKYQQNSARENRRYFDQTLPNALNQLFEQADE